MKLCRKVKETRFPELSGTLKFLKVSSKTFIRESKPLAIK